MDREKRKREHITNALNTGQSGRQGMDELHLIPNSLPEVSYGHTDLAAQLQELSLSSPIMINAMTGGAESTTEINRRLAVIAREKKLAMAVGSQMSALRHPTPSIIESYQIVRKVNPDGLIFANLGAEASPDEAKRAVEMIDANALQIHLNVMQELLMPEGDRDFCGYLRNIERIAASLSVPLIVKEVGFGMPRNTIKQLIQAGVRIIDLGGAGGTNFAKVENRRSETPLAMFEEWGLTTVQSLLEAAECKADDVSFIASGGIRHGLDIVKALALGASAAGMAGYFLKLVQSSSLEQCLAEVDLLHHQIRVAMTALGTNSLTCLKKIPLTISGETGEWAKQRGICLRTYAMRGLEIS